jgi:hypothetical protein
MVKCAFFCFLMMCGLVGCGHRDKRLSYVQRQRLGSGDTCLTLLTKLVRSTDNYRNWPGSISTGSDGFLDTSTLLIFVYAKGNGYNPGRTTIGTFEIKKSPPRLMGLSADSTEEVVCNRTLLRTIVDHCIDWPKPGEPIE